MKILKVKCLAPTRLDNYLMQQFPALNPGRLNKALRENKIKLNGKKQPLSTRVQAGDEIRLFLLPDQLKASGPVEGPAFLGAKYPAKVVYEDDQLLIADKPAGLPVSDDAQPDTLIHRVLLYLHQKGEYQPGGGFTPALCHRLDTGTSGLVLLAKNNAAEAFLTAAIKARDIEKRYLCVTFGRPNPPAALLRDYLLKDAERGIVRITDTTAGGAKEVITGYETLAVSGRLALLEVELVTGRTHQIRVHMASTGHPLAGDAVYGPKNCIKSLNGQCLHAKELGFVHPRTGEWMQFDSPLPPYFADFITRLRKEHRA